jgi:hypothetical protein
MADEHDILNQLQQGEDLSNIDTEFPVLAAGDVMCEVAKIEVAANSKQTGNNLVIQLKTLEPAESTKGEVVNPGYPITQWISLVQTEKYDPRNNLATFQDAVLGTTQGNRGPFFPLEQFENEQVLLRVKPEPDNNGVLRTRIIRFVKKA